MKIINEQIRVKKRFKYKDIELRIVERNEPYMNASEPVRITRVLAPNGGSIPIQIQRKETLKSIAARTISIIEDFEKRGANASYELTKTI